MGMTCAEILKNPRLKDLKLVAGQEGLGRAVRWVYIAECLEDPRDAANWVFGGELVFITGHALKGSSGGLLAMIDQLNQKQVAGIVINIGPFFASIPPEVIGRANLLALPVFELPWQSKLVDVTQDICSAIVTKELEQNNLANLFDSILFGRVNRESDFASQARRHGVDLDAGCAIGVIEADHFADYLAGRALAYEEVSADFRGHFLRTASQVFAHGGLKALVAVKGDALVFLINTSPGLHDKFPPLLDEVQAGMRAFYPDLGISAGIGTAYLNVNELHRSYQEAEQALRISRCEPGSACFYSQLGFYLLLLKIGDRQFLEDYYQELFRPLIEFDKGTRSHLMATLEAFLAAGGSLDQTARQLFIHKNTLKYRIQKIERILECDLTDMQQMFRLAVGMKIGRFLYKP